MKIKKRIFALAMLLGLLTVTVLYTYIKGINQAPAAEIILKNVVVAVNTIPAHVTISEDMLVVKSIASDSVHPTAFTSIAEAVGGTTNTIIVNGEQLLKDRIITDNASSSLSYRIPENMRAMTIPLTEITGVGGYIVTGDKIDILATYAGEAVDAVKFTITQFQSVEVLEIGPYNANNTAQQGGVSSSITLLVNPEQAEVLAYANLTGTLHFTLRNPADSNKVNLQQFDSGNFNTWRER